MAWTLDWSSGNQDWHSVANVTDFQKAVNERITMLNEIGTLTLKNIGDDVQRHQWIEDIQVWIAANYGNFVRSHDTGGNALSNGVYDNSATIDIYSSLADLFDRTGLTNSTWRRYTTHPDDAGADLGGVIQAGDIIGPWLFEDMQACLNRLVWTRYKGDWVHGGVNPNLKVGDGDDAVEATAKTEAETDFDGDSQQENRTPDCFSWVFHNGTYQTNLTRSKSYSQLTGVDDSVSRDADWYIYSAAPILGGGGNAWNDNGDDVIEDKYSYWLTDAPATASTTITSSTNIGTLASYPAWATYGGPPSNTYYEGWVGGSIVTYYLAVLRWNVTNGFVYQ